MKGQSRLTIHPRHTAGHYTETNHTLTIAIRQFHHVMQLGPAEVVAMSRRPSPNKLVRGCAGAGLAACAAPWRGHGDTTTALAVAAGVAAIVAGAGPAGGSGWGEGAGVRAGTDHALGPRTLSGWPENGHTKLLIVLPLATRQIKIII